VDTGNTVIVIEHNLDVVKTADWIVDLGPEGGDKGGYVIAEGTPEQVAATPGSATGEYLARVLRGEPLVPLSAVTFAEAGGHVRLAEPAPVEIAPLPEKRAAAVGTARAEERS
jgi:excinuclease ABC subunit A